MLGAKDIGMSPREEGATHPEKGKVVCEIHVVVYENGIPSFTFTGRPLGRQIKLVEKKLFKAYVESQKKVRTGRTEVDVSDDGSEVLKEQE